MSTRICALTDIPTGGASRVDVDGHRLAVIRFDDDSVYVLGDECTHADFSLAEGEVDCDERTIECWKHGSAFGVDDGVPRSLPATKPTATYAVTVSDGDVFVDLASQEQS